MPDVARALREEITRLARKETKAGVQPLAKQIRELRMAVRDQKKQISELRKQLSRKADNQPQAQIDPRAADQKAVRISPGSIKKHRGRLGLSQKQLGLLLGVSSLTVGNWENGHSVPRGQNRLAIAELRRMRVRDAQARLGKLSQ